jgi:ADP-heptose:LPS heptosyltransferase/predicted SAM-dependent methyltransferase
MTWRAEDPQGNEAAKIRWELVPYTRGHGLDIGCGPYKTFAHFIGVDNGHHWGLKGVNLPVETAEKLPLVASQSCDFVFSSHLLEHIQDYKAALKEWWRVLKVGGYLCLYLPHKDFYPNVGQAGANPDHKHDFVPSDIVDAMKCIGGFDLVRNEPRNEDCEYSFFQVYKKLNSDKHRFSHAEPLPEKRAAVVRYGAFGDLIMMSSICPLLKQQGYHVTVYTTPNGHQVVSNDPHIDHFIIQDTDQVPNEDLYDFWANEEKKYHKFINLSESVEASLLTLPNRIAAKWPKSLRDKLLERNYLEFTHDIAEVPHVFSARFYPTAQESEWARKEKAKIGRFVLYSLSGSSIHKAWPHMDALLARLLMQTDYKIVLTGSDMDKLLEQGWELEPRVLKHAGVWTIRETMSMLPHADLIIGAETGVLNAASMLPVPKIVTLSHSSVENLTKHWVNTVSLTPKKTPCYPCHMMHYDWTACVKGSLGVSLCQENIDIEDMWEAVQHILKTAVAA